MPLCSHRVAAFYIFLSSMMLSVATVLVKILSNQFSGVFIAFFRFCIGIILVLPILFFKRSRVGKIRIKSLVLRGMFGSVSMILFFISIQYIGSGRSTLLLNLFPVFVLISGFLFFSEKMKLKNILVIGICVIGTFFIFSDKQLPSMMGAGLGILAGMTRGVGVHFVKKAGSENHILLVYFSVCIFGLILFPFSFSEFHNINTPGSALILIVIGVLTLGAQTLLTFGLRFISATSGSIIAYSSIPITICLSLLVGELLNPNYIIGIFFIIAGILINLFFKKWRQPNEEDDLRKN